MVTFFAPLVPPVLSPLGYSITGILLLQKTNPRLLSVITVWIGTFTAILIWELQHHIIKRITLYESTPKTNILLRIINDIHLYFKHQKRIARLSLKREQSIETKTGKIATFLFAIFCFLPILPDIVGTRILYKKIKFPYFVLAVIIGKSITHVPFIFVWKSLIQLLHIQI